MCNLFTQGVEEASSTPIQALYANCMGSRAFPSTSNSSCLTSLWDYFEMTSDAIATGLKPFSFLWVSILATGTTMDSFGALCSSRDINVTEHFTESSFCDTNQPYAHICPIFLKYCLYIKAFNIWFDSLHISLSSSDCHFTHSILTKCLLQIISWAMSHWRP